MSSQMKPPPMLASNSPVKASPAKPGLSSSSSGGSGSGSGSAPSSTKKEALTTPPTKGVKRSTPGSGDSRPSSQGKEKQLKLSSDSKPAPKPAAIFTPKSSSSSSNSSNGGGGSAERRASSSESSSSKLNASKSNSSANKLNSSASKIDRLAHSHKRPPASHKAGSSQKKEKHKSGHKSGKGMQKFDKYGKVIKPEGLKSMKKVGAKKDRGAVSSSSSSKPSDSSSSSTSSASHKSSNTSVKSPSSSSSSSSAAASKAARPMRTGPSAFALYSRDNKKIHAAAHPELDEGQVRRGLFDNWKSMSDVDKAPYLKKEKEIKDQAEKDASANAPKSPSKAPSSSEKDGSGSAGGGSAVASASASAASKDGAAAAPKKSHKKGGGMMNFVTKLGGPVKIKPRSKEAQEMNLKRKEEEKERMRKKLLTKDQLKKEKEATKQREKEERRVEREKERLKLKEVRMRKKEEEKAARKIARERNKPRDDDELVEENSKNPLPVPMQVDVGERLGPDQICDVMMLAEFFQTFASAFPTLNDELKRIFRGSMPTFSQIEKVILRRRSTPDLMQILACMVLIVQETDQQEYVKVDEVKEKSIFGIEMAQLPCNEFTATEVLRMYLERMKREKGKEVSFTSELTLTSALPETTDIIDKLYLYDARTLSLMEMLALLKFLCNECLMDNPYITDLIRNAPEKSKQLKRERETMDSRQKEITKEREASNGASSKSGVGVVDADAALAAMLAAEEHQGRRATRTMTETPLEKQMREKKESDQALDEEEEEMQARREDLEEELDAEEGYMRSRILGVDRNRAQYLTMYSAHGIFVQQLSGELGVFQQAEDIDLLMASLNDRGLREKALKETLTEEYDDLKDSLAEASKKVRNRKRSLSSGSGFPTSPEMKEETDGEDDGDEDEDGGGGGGGDADAGVHARAAPPAVLAPTKGSGVMPRTNYSCTGAIYGSLALAAKTSTPLPSSSSTAPSAFMETADEPGATPATAAAPSPAPSPAPAPGSASAPISNAASSDATIVVKVENTVPAPSKTNGTPVVMPLPENRQFFEVLKENESPEAVETWMLKQNIANILTFNQDVVDGGFGWVSTAEWVKSVKAAKTAQELAAKLVELEAELDLKYMKWPLGRDSRPKSKSTAESISETAVVGQWRQYSETVQNTSQLSLLYELIWLSMRWEKSSKDAKCKVCRKSSDPESMLMCDGCDTGFHMACLSPRLVTIPVGDWHCKGCKPQALTARKAAQQKISSYVVPGSDDELLVEESDSEIEEEDDDEGDDDEDEYNNEEDGGADDDSESDDDGPSLAAKRKAAAVFASSTRGGQREDDMKKAFEIWKGLRDHPDAYWFMKPVEIADLPDYFEHIKTPMDLGTIKSKIDSVAYDDREDFAADVRLVFDNCAQYNPESTEVAQHGRNVMKLFGKLYKKFFAPKQKAKKSRR